MILLDTNVISEAMKPVPDPAVLGWLNEQPVRTLYVSSVTLAELLFGIGCLPKGKRRRGLGEALLGLLTLCQQRVLPFDTGAACHYARFSVRARAAGRGVPTADGYIGAVAAANGFIVATRDTAPFVAAGLAVVNPWHPGSAPTPPAAPKP
ncbi:PIN domain-containing protein [Paracidovorax citrulli]